MTEAEEHEACGAERVGRLAGDDEAAAGQRRDGQSGTLEVLARLFDLDGPDPGVSLDGPTIHDRVRDGLEPPSGVATAGEDIVHPHGCAPYSCGRRPPASKILWPTGETRMTRGTT